MRFPSNEETEEILYPKKYRETDGILSILRGKGSLPLLVYFGGFVVASTAFIVMPLAYGSVFEFIWVLILKFAFLWVILYIPLAYFREINLLGLTEDSLIIRRWNEKFYFPFCDISSLVIKPTRLSTIKIVINLKDGTSYRFRITPKLLSDPKQEAFEMIMDRLQKSEKMMGEIVDQNE